MKFGETLKQKIKPEWKFYYINYDGLKELIKERTSAKDFFEESDEASFVNHLEMEMQKVLDFRDVKIGELTRHVQYCEEKINNDTVKDDKSKQELETEISRVTDELVDLSSFTRLNYTGFIKILKKHDKHTAFMLKPMFMIRLKSKPFFLETLDNLVYRLSKLFDRLRRGDVDTKDSASNEVKDNQVFLRKTTKYWVHPDNVAEVKCIILKYLPVLVFPNEFGTIDQAISSVYFDNDVMDLYRGRLEKNEGAEAIRLRWYGSPEPNEVFVERKTHREDWTGEISCKERFTVKAKHVNEYLAGKYSADEIKTKVLKEGISEEKAEKTRILAEEVQNSVLNKKLKPTLRTFYNRTAFQLPADASVRISLDTELTMIKEDVPSNRNWKRNDFDKKHPFSNLNENEVVHFPYAILEVKLQTQYGSTSPAWVENLVKSHLVEEVPKFSKYIHGCSILYEDRIDLFPFWLPQMDVDIRKPGISNDSFDASETESNPALRNNHIAIDIGGDDEDEKLPMLQSKSQSRRDVGTGVSSKPQNQGNTAEKRISIPVRIEPKVFFANERTFLSWIHFSIFLGGISTALVGLGNANARISGYIFAVVSILFTIYALYLYQWRAAKIRQKDPGPYDDRVGPMVVVVVFLAAMTLNVIFTISGSN
jgi:SPX domain protein involved in polyphosphate accumulation/uncharacterized membrane protein YidH (DUF202 family)